MIILQNKNNKNTLRFYDKELLLDFIEEHRNLDFEDVEIHAKANDLSTNIRKWPICQLIDLYFSDYERVYKKDL